MVMNKEIITIETIPEIIDWGNMQYQLDDKTILHYIEIIDYDEDAFPQVFTFSCTFYDCNYQTIIYWEDVNINYATIYHDGPSILFSSFEDNMTNEHWELLSTLIKKLVNEQNN